MINNECVIQSSNNAAIHLAFDVFSQGSTHAHKLQHEHSGLACAARWLHATTLRQILTVRREFLLYLVQFDVISGSETSIAVAAGRLLPVCDHDARIGSGIEDREIAEVYDGANAGRIFQRFSQPLAIAGTEELVRGDEAERAAIVQELEGA